MSSRCAAARRSPTVDPSRTAPGGGRSTAAHAGAVNTRSHPPTPDPPPAGAPGLPDRAPILGPAPRPVPVLVDAGYVLALAAQRNQATVSNCIFDVSRIVGLLRDAV